MFLNLFHNQKSNWSLILDPFFYNVLQFTFTLFPFCSFLNYWIEGCVEMNCLKHLLYHEVQLTNHQIFLPKTQEETGWPRVLLGPWCCVTDQALSICNCFLYGNASSIYAALNVYIFLQSYFSSLLRSLCRKLRRKYTLFQFHYYVHYNVITM